jgi:alginate O-acetyltransferase complex protein AlgI
MLFNSVDFLYFFVFVTTGFFLVPHKWRWFLLLIASCYFYMAFVPYYILILFLTIFIDYFAGIFIENEKQFQRKKLYLIISIISNIGILCLFKYYNFFLDTFHKLLLNFNLHWEDIPYLNILLPIGLSFHTFQALSYTIEVYRGNQKAERHLGIYSLYVLFYPQLVAGPIERPQNVLHQFHEKKYFNWDNLFIGLKLIFWGLFKKVVIADRLAPFVNSVYDSPDNWQGFPVILAFIFFSIQIYCDFSGYSDIALGSARTMGFDLMTNFRRPYLSKSITEFWSRWHISLSTWFRDYVYIPLGGNRVKKSRIYLNVLIVFMLSGLWHGANWTFIVWGAFHGFTIILERFLKIDTLMINNNFVNLLRVILVFTLVSLAWVFFRADNFNDVSQLISSAFQIDKTQVGWYTFGDYKYELILSLISILFLIGVELKYDYLTNFLSSCNFAFRSVIYLFLILMLLSFGAFHSSGEFIYFQF